MGRDQNYAIVVDNAARGSYLFQNDGGRPRFVDDFYISTGKRGAQSCAEGDQKTPVGVYRVTAEPAGTEVVRLYGAGAFPISYPNEWDRREGRNGHGIWLHGTPKGTLSAGRARRRATAAWSSNQDLKRWRKICRVGLTPGDH